MGSTAYKPNALRLGLLCEPVTILLSPLKRFDSRLASTASAEQRRTPATNRNHQIACFFSMSSGVSVGCSSDWPVGGHRRAAGRRAEEFRRRQRRQIGLGRIEIHRHLRTAAARPMPCSRTE